LQLQREARARETGFKTDVTSVCLAHNALFSCLVFDTIATALHQLGRQRGERDSHRGLGGHSMDFQLPRNVPSGHVLEVESLVDDASTAAPATACADVAGRSGARRRLMQRSEEEANVADERDAVRARVLLRAALTEAAAAAGGGGRRVGAIAVTARVGMVRTWVER
jgi:hypothetical protein